MNQKKRANLQRRSQFAFFAAREARRQRCCILPISKVFEFVLYLYSCNIQGILVVSKKMIKKYEVLTSQILVNEIILSHLINRWFYSWNLFCFFCELTLFWVQNTERYVQKYKILLCCEIKYWNIFSFLSFYQVQQYRQINFPTNWIPAIFPSPTILSSLWIGLFFSEFSLTEFPPINE